ncbi:haloacid dehalogenase type II [Vannielia litorea]|uniref:haloacid dehalogenase type II n=1 Tax=Vannielia litorea TaxID=1217970 RepID=UPI001C964800|nr:haloacid dehalogenase type II [Vannielia litorea]MBY6048527.1 haloacid dehalogenase type II [Vannielia litorea]MBY6075941.1 haloacid dehalogenase type II [Vannielia litorea]
MTIKACVFDAYGTLFDVSAAAREAAAEPGREALAACWQALAETWRGKQLGYSWLRAITGAHCDFWQVTGEALDYAMAEQKLADPELRERLMALYFELSAYAEVPEMLAELKAGGFATAILSNGSPEMLMGAVTSAGIGGVLDAVISVEDVGVFKPDRRVYDLVGTTLKVEPAEVLFVSSNGWDAAAAAGYGFQTAWVNRAGLPMDRLPWRPAHELTDLTPIPDLAGRL